MNLDPEQRVAGIAAGALLFTLFLPWYQKSVAIGGKLVEDNISAWGVFTFVEAAVLLVCLGVFALLWARSQDKPFHLPGGDGTVIFAAGLWSAVLLLWRVFDRPDVEGDAATVGIAWGFFFAFLAAAGLAVAGWRLRLAHLPEPDNPIADPEPPRPVRRRPVRPELSADPPEYDAPTRRAPADPADEPTRRSPPTRRLFADPANPDDDEGPNPDQLAFDDEPTRRMP